MSTGQNAPGRRYGLLALALILILSGGIVIYIGSHNFAIRAVGIAIVMASTYLVQISNSQNRSKLSVASGEMSKRDTGSVVGRVLWIFSLSLLPILAGAWYMLHLDAVNGGQEAWPADLFAGVGLVCAVVWGLLVAKILGGRGRAK